MEDNIMICGNHNPNIGMFCTKSKNHLGNHYLCLSDGTRCYWPNKVEPCTATIIVSRSNYSNVTAHVTCRHTLIDHPLYHEYGEDNTKMHIYWNDLV